MIRARALLALLSLALAAPLLSGDPARAATKGPHLLKTAFRSYLSGRESRVGAEVLDLESGRAWRYHPHRYFNTGSIVKVQILGALLHRAQTERRALTHWERHHAELMIERSNNDAATRLWNTLGGAGGIGAFDLEAGLWHTFPSVYWGLTLTTAMDQVRLLRTFLRRSPLYNAERRGYALRLMQNVVSRQHWGVSAGPPGDETVALKNGWLPEGDERDWIVNSVGWVSGHGSHYILAVLTEEDRTKDYGIATIQHLSRIVWNRLDPPPPTDVGGRLLLA
jgi:beta-lactamase class A